MKPPLPRLNTDVLCTWIHRIVAHRTTYDNFAQFRGLSRDLGKKV